MPNIWLFNHLINDTTQTEIYGKLEEFWSIHQEQLDGSQRSKTLWRLSDGRRISQQKKKFKRELWRSSSLIEWQFGLLVEWMNRDNIDQRCLTKSQQQSWLVRINQVPFELQ